jgi:hypothetical protein
VQILSSSPKTPLGRALRRAGIWVAASGLVVFAAGADAQRYDNRQERCQDLERQLVSDWQLSNNPQNATQRIDQQLAEADRNYRRAQAEADRRDCYEDMFIFGRSLRRTPNCIQLDSEIEAARRSIANLRQQREGINSSASRRGRRDELVAELARNGCGENYAQEYEQRRRRSNSFFSLWEDEDSGDRGGSSAPLPQQSLPFASYRTMCVRSCDGYYFPISFATVSSRFRDDDAKCRSLCAAPAELYYYRNPGEEVEQMVSIEGRPYKESKNAFKHRQSYVKGCSCKPEEYSLQEINQSADGKRADAGKAAGGSAGSASTPKSAPQSLDALTGAGGSGTPPTQQPRR